MATAIQGKDIRVSSVSRRSISYTSRGLKNCRASQHRVPRPELGDTGGAVQDHNVRAVLSRISRDNGLLRNEPYKVPNLHGGQMVEVSEANASTTFDDMRTARWKATRRARSSRRAARLRRARRSRTRCPSPLTKPLSDFAPGPRIRPTQFSHRGHRVHRGIQILVLCGLCALCGKIHRRQ